MKENNYEETNQIPVSTIGQDPFQQSSNKISKPLIAGILMIIAGALSVLMWVGLASMNVSLIETTIMPEFESISSEYGSMTFSAESIKDLFVICGSVGFFLSIFMILGGIMSIKRQMWGLALAGGILGLFTIGPLFVSSALSLIGLILVIISKNEFQ
ncbi:MAG: hypothetical protein KAW47_09970 [Thermoplasmatales archaeon]|nr:hypothetical protein [Thermoplasmatales archaeon]